MAALNTAGSVPPATPARRASPSAGNASCRGASNSRLPSAAKSGAASPPATRSGQVSAYWIGKHMSARLSCASTEPSMNSTIEWTIDCGCTSTPMRSMPMPNNQCASIISSPLLHSVAESIVTFGPISQVGCASACATVTSASRPAGHVRNGPPDAVRISRATSPAPPRRPSRH